MSPSVVCEGYWRRESPFTRCTITDHYGCHTRDWYGVPNHRVTVEFENGIKRAFKGTFKSSRCLKLAVKADGRTPTGTLTCNQCARVPTLQSFVSKMQTQTESSTTSPASKSKFTPNITMSQSDALTKLSHLAKEVKELKRKVRRHVVRKRTEVAREALLREDVKKFTKELQFIAQRGTLDDKKVMWNYFKDVVHNEFLTARKGPTGSRGMRWSSDVKDFAASQKLMAGKRLPAHLRENIGGPSRMTILRHLRSVRTQIQPGSSGCQVNMEAIAHIWAPLIHKRRIDHPNLKVIMVELSEDESGINPKIEYWREKDSIFGSCGSAR